MSYSRFFGFGGGGEGGGGASGSQNQPGSMRRVGPQNLGYQVPAVIHHPGYVRPPPPPPPPPRQPWSMFDDMLQQQQQQQYGGGTPGHGRRRSYQDNFGDAVQNAEEEDENAQLIDLHDGDDEEGRETHAEYTPAQLKGGRPHPGHVVESRGLTSCDPPPITYKLKIPRQVLDAGLLSILQAEAVFYACQQHELFMPTGERSGFALGDSTGIGKGRILASIIWENKMRGRDRAVWITASPFLAAQIKRDCKDIGLKLRIFELREQKLKGNPNLFSLGPGLMIVTYRTLLYKENGGNGTSRVDQLISWMGGNNFDGVLALDESHKAKNLVSEHEGKPTSKTAKVIFDLQKRLPQARVVYSSATLATCSQNLECLSRLHLWGDGTSFPSSAKFSEAIRSAGLPALELVALSLKSQGKYLARTLGFKDCLFEVVNAPMPKGFSDMYDACARQWEQVRQDLMMLVPPGSATLRRRKRKKKGEDESDIVEEDAFVPPTEEEKAKAKIWMLFWSYHMRFFASLFVASKVPYIIEKTREAIDNGHQVIIGIQATGESQIKASQISINGENDFAVGEVSQSEAIFESFLKRHVTDHLGEGTSEIRERHLAWLRDYSMNLPRNPLDEMIDTFGNDMVAELTGRTLRFVNGKYSKENISQAEHERARKDFQQGRKEIAIISEAASVGISLHSDRREPTKDRRRVHFILELAWGADRTLQQLGRSHRSNEQTGPIYRLVASEALGGDVRFACSVARRLESLGAITQGDKGASQATLDLSDLNVESIYGDQAVEKTLATEPENLAVTKGLDVLQSRADNGMDVRRFFNTMLGLEIEAQRRIASIFFGHFSDIVKEAKLNGTYEGNGIINVRGEAVQRQGPIKRYKTSQPGEPEAYMRMVKLSLDRGISYDQALEILGQTGREPRRGGDGFYADRHGKKPFLAIRRGDQHFKLIRPDLGRQAYQAKSQEDILTYRYLSPEEAKDCWMERYEEALTKCSRHNRKNCCDVGLRLKTRDLLSFELTKQWAIVKELLGRKRLRLIRAETTTEPVEGFVGVMVTKPVLRRLESKNFAVSYEEEEAIEMGDDGKDAKKKHLDELLEDKKEGTDDNDDDVWDVTGRGKKKAAGNGNGGDAAARAGRGGGGGGAAASSSSKKAKAKEADSDVELIDLVSSGDEGEDGKKDDGYERDDDDILMVDDNEDDDGQSITSREERRLLGEEDEDDDDVEVLKSAASSGGAKRRSESSESMSSTSTAPPPVNRSDEMSNGKLSPNSQSGGEDEDATDDDDDMMLLGSQKAKVCIGGKTKKEEDEASRQIKRGRFDSGPAAVSGGGGSGGGSSSAAGGGGAGAVMRDGAVVGDDDGGDDDLVMIIHEFLDDLRDENVITREELKTLRRRVCLKDEDVYDAYFRVQDSQLSVSGKGRMFRKAVSLD